MYNSSSTEATPRSKWLANSVNFAKRHAPEVDDTVDKPVATARSKWIGFNSTSRRANVKSTTPTATMTEVTGVIGAQWDVDPVNPKVANRKQRRPDKRGDSKWISYVQEHKATIEAKLREDLPPGQKLNGNLIMKEVDGEIDIIENVRSSVSNQVSWHTTAGCNLTYPGNYTGIAGSTICDHNYMSNTGCGIVDPSIASFGPTFNAKGGGVYAMKWDSESIDVWFFYRTAIPDDITNGLPDPAGWPTPSASLSHIGCPIDQYFRNHELILDTTLCDDWAGSSSSYNSAGCPGTCPERVMEPANFVNATWSINSIKIYNKTIINTAYLEAGASSPVWSFRAWGWSALVAGGILWIGQGG